MSEYRFLCQECNREFTLVRSIAEMEKGGVCCPHCGSRQVVQQLAAFSAVTAKKS